MRDVDVTVNAEAIVRRSEKTHVEPVLSKLQFKCTKPLYLWILYILCNYIIIYIIYIYNYIYICVCVCDITFYNLILQLSHIV